MTENNENGVTDPADEQTPVIDPAQAARALFNEQTAQVEPEPEPEVDDAEHSFKSGGPEPAQAVNEPQSAAAFNEQNHADAAAALAGPDAPGYIQDAAAGVTDEMVVQAASQGGAASANPQDGRLDALHVRLAEVEAAIAAHKPILAFVARVKAWMQEMGIGD